MAEERAPVEADPNVPPAAVTAGEEATLVARMERESNPVKRWFMVLGPGIVTGASDDDPSGIATYAVAGASFGFATLWTALVSLPLMASVQFVSAKIGMVGGTGLAGVIRAHYSRKLLYPVVLCLVVANALNAGADIGAIAAAINLIVPVPVGTMIVPIAVAIIALQFWASYQLIAKTFKWLTLALLAYIGAGLIAHPPLADVLRGTFVPTFRLDVAFISTLMALLGTTISPYLWFWQSSQEVEEEIAQGRSRLWQRRGATETELRYKAWDVNIGMFFSNLVMYFIIFTTAATLFRAGKTDIGTATDAAEALRPLAGAAAKYLLALGLIGSGLLAVPVLTGAGAYAMSEAFGWGASLGDKPHRAKRFYLVIALSTVVGLLVNYVGVSPIKALFYSAVVNGLIAAPLLVLVMLIGNNRAILGDRVNGRAINALGWATTILMAIASCVLIGFWITGKGS